MNMRDLSMDDDFLSHLLVEKLGTGDVPLFVHKMDSSRKLPKSDANDLLQIVRRLVMNKSPIHHAIRQAVDELLMLPAVRYYLKSYTQKQTNAFATHASRYFELYHPSGSIEIAHTSRYAHRTGKSELCILATRNLAPGSVITELKGSMANLTDEEDKELKRTDLQNFEIRRDFSVIHSKQMKKNHLFLGPARFVNHDCDNNCELFREGKYITFRVLRPISIGDEITAHYGDGYFGRKNRHCLCETCEKNGRGGYAPDYDENEPEPNSSSDSDTESASSMSDSGSESAQLNVNERRTRRGVYAILSKNEDGESDDSDEELHEIELQLGSTGAMDLEEEGKEATLPVHSFGSTAIQVSSKLDSTCLARSLSSLSSLSSDTSGKPDSADKRSTRSVPFRSIISTRRQKAKEVEQANASATTAFSQAGSSSLTPELRRSTRSASLASSPRKGKGGDKTLTPTMTPTSRRRSTKDEVNVKKEELEPRSLRARASTSQSSESTKAAPTKVIPRGPDGKPLPLCVTCSNVLPVISVDSKVVWGLGFENSYRRKKHKLECPRCMRHFAIYAQPWPCRLPLHGHSPSFLPTPREEATPVDNTNRRVTQKALPVLDRKLQAAAAALAASASSSPKAKRRTQSHEEERPAKRARTKSSRETTDSRAHKGSICSIEDPEAANAEEPAKRKRGRPRIHFPETKPVAVKEEEQTTMLSSLASKHPRNTNGQFTRKTSSNSVLLSSLGKSSEEQSKPPSSDTDTNNGIHILSNSSNNSPRQRKHLMDDMEKGDHPRKRSLRRRSNGQEEPGPEKAPLQKVLPRPTCFRGIRLLTNPNPLCFALQAWGGPVILDDSSSSSDEDDKGLATPEDNQSPPATIVDPVDVSHRAPSACLKTPVLLRGPLTYKPSPFTFAKRRWASVTDMPGCEHEALNVVESGTPPSEEAENLSGEFLCDEPTLSHSTSKVPNDITHTDRKVCPVAFSSGVCREN
ncbi:hypothetical protein AMATHDRAFT_143887 [Amanita thiersii Skay4041]|uniref:SET domain-containing protein n=1 Tax=Amanita thiersii Skay4041 TaxID=703135 RepID=A0A2A9NRH5_9AGAR|nr:hypothetical protein AMATHDRAFT_143887 [Amanita thiersii Skay4041]